MAAVRARRLRVRGIVQGVGFRPFVYRLAAELGLAGWVLNGEQGVEIHVEGSGESIADFVRLLAERPPPAAEVSDLEERPADLEHRTTFEIRSSEREGRPTTRISPDLPVCDACAAELVEPRDRRRGYPYINCTDCGPRYSIVLGLPYDRPQTTMAAWPMCPACAAEYEDPLDRRFHAQPVACPECGPTYVLEADKGVLARGDAAIDEAAARLGAGEILAVKGLGGYHLACDARSAPTVAALRERKFRKEKPFAVMVRELASAHRLVALDSDSERLLASAARPIVLAPARRELSGVAPGNSDLGVMLAYTPLHLLLFAAGCPEVLVLTSANRSSEPIAYRDREARERLEGIADVFLVGERPIARRVDDSVARVGVLGPVVLRRSRGYAPAVVARLPADQAVLALGADLKNSITLVVGGEAVVSQHIGDLEQLAASEAFEETIDDLLRMYELEVSEVIVAHDLHPEYRSTRYAHSLRGAGRVAVQHHRAHVASVLAEHGELERPVLGIAFDGTGYGDDGAIWGGELFVGSVRDGFQRTAHLRPAALAGGDAAARHPVQAAAGFLDQLDGLPDLSAAPFSFPELYQRACELLAKKFRTFETTSVGRLFDAVAALSGFTRATTYEGQAAIWLEQQALRAQSPIDPLPIGFAGGELDFRPALRAVIEARLAGRPVPEIAEAFHQGLALSVAEEACRICREQSLRTVVLSGGVFQNQLLVGALAQRLASSELEVWTNHRVPPNDGGVSLGQAALASWSPAPSLRRGVPQA